MNATTPTASVGGEPVKAYLLRYWVPPVEGLASVIVDKTAIVMGQGLFLILGLTLARTVVSASGPIVTVMTVLLGVEALAVTGFVVVQLLGTAGRGGRLLARFGMGPSRSSQERLEGLDRTLAEFYRWRRRRLAAGVLVHLTASTVGSLEIYLVLNFLGLPVPLLTAVVLESFGTAVKFASFMIPASIGALEGGNVAIFAAFGLGGGVGLSYTLVRRLREITWATAGMIALTALSGRPAPVEVEEGRRPVPATRVHVLDSTTRRRTTDHTEDSLGSVRVAIVGVGNCASALVQGVQFYRTAPDDGFIPGLMRPRLGPYHVRDIEFSAAFDIDARKVGADLSEAIATAPNNTVAFAEVPRLDVPVHRGMTHDGLGHYLSQVITKAPGSTADIAGILRETRTDVVVNFLPVGSEMATKWYVEQVLDAGCGFVNCIPVFIAREEYWRRRFEERGLPIVGDDVKSQVGATIVHRVLARLFMDRGVRLDRTSQLNVGGNTDFYNMLERTRLESKKVSKTDAVRSQLSPRDARRGHPHRPQRLRALAGRPQVGAHPARGARLRRAAHQHRAQAGGVGLAQLRGSGHRRHPLLQDRDGSRAQGRPPRPLRLPHEVAPRAVVGRRGAHAPRAVHLRRRVARPLPALPDLRPHSTAMLHSFGSVDFHSMIAISRTGRMLRRLVRVSCRRPYLTVALSLILALAGITVTVQGLRFKTSGRDVLPQSAGYVQRYVEYARDFGELEDIVVVVEARTFEAAKAYASRLVQELRDSAVNFPRASYRIDPKRFEGRELLYLSPETLRQIRDQDLRPPGVHGELRGGPQPRPAPGRREHPVRPGLHEQRVRPGPRGQDLPPTHASSRSFSSRSSSASTGPRRTARRGGRSSPSGGTAEADAGYFLSDDKSLLFVLVETPKGDKGSFVGDYEAIATVRDAVERLRVVFPNVQAGVTGSPVLSNDEMSAAIEDSQVATILAFALTLGLIWLSFLRVGKPTLMLVVLAVSIAWSMGVVTLFVGHLTIFSVMFISIVVGVGIDYGIYFLFRYEEEIFLGRNLREALERTAARAGPAILLGALTAAASFYVLMLTDFKGIKEFGFIAGSAIMLAWLSMMTCFPAVLVLVDSHHAARPRNQKPPAHQLERIRVPLLDRLTRYPVTVLTAALAVTVACAFALPWVGFDYNLLNLQAKGTESVAWEKRTLATTGRSGFNALASATSLEELRKKQAAFERLPSVSEVDSVIRLIPDEQPEKIADHQEPRAAGGPGARQPVEPGRPRPAHPDGARPQAALRHCGRRGRRPASPTTSAGSASRATASSPGSPSPTARSRSLRSPISRPSSTVTSWTSSTCSSATSARARSPSPMCPTRCAGSSSGQAASSSSRSIPRWTSGSAKEPSSSCGSSARWTPT